MAIEFNNYTTDDIEVIKRQLGCREVYIWGVPRRCEFGYPAIILLHPLKEIEGKMSLNFKAISNVMWLTCPYLNTEIHELENSGLIKDLGRIVNKDDLLRDLMARAHANYYFVRNYIFMKHAGKYYRREDIGIVDRGIGGTRDITTLKCLHIHFCHLSIFSENVAGRIVYELLDGKVNCGKNLCSRFRGQDCKDISLKCNAVHGRP